MGTVMELERVRTDNSAPEIFDIHAHVLPGIDDGAGTWDMSMQMLRLAWASGVRKVVATPHYLPWEKKTSPDHIRELCMEAAQRFRNLYEFEMMIYPGEELYYYTGLLDDLQAGTAMTMNDTNVVLVEFGVMTQYEDMRHAVQNLERSGYRVILAHYERYKALRKKERIEELVNLGIMLQSNLEAIDAGYFDSEARRVRRDYKTGMISFSGSDMHNITSRSPISKKDIRNLSGCLRKEEIRKVLYDNAAEILL